MASVYHKAWVERKNDRLSLLKELIVKYGDNLEITVNSLEEIKLIRERLNLISAWKTLDSKDSLGELLTPLVLVIKRIGPSYGEYDCDWCHGFSGTTNRGYKLDKNEILLHDELTAIVKEIREEIHGAPLKDQYDAEGFASRNPCKEIQLPSGGTAILKGI